MRSRALLPFVVAFALSACFSGGDSDDWKDGGSSVGGGGAGGGAGGGVGGGAGGGAGGGTGDGGAAACVGPGDVLAVQFTDIETVAENCGAACIAAGDVWTCTRDCFVTETGKTGFAASDPCAACLADWNICVESTCPSVCIPDRSGTGCAECQCSTCGAAFQACAGVATPTCPAQ